MGEKVIADLDGDGLLEIAFSNSYGYVYVYESPADDTWQRVWSTSTENDVAYGVEVGKDTDGNGKPELFICGETWDYPPEWGIPYYTTIIYESAEDDSLMEVARLRWTDGRTSSSGMNAIGNLDGAGRQEYVMRVSEGLQVYRATAPGTWTQILWLDNPGFQKEPRIFDVNNNGRDELLWTTDANLQVGLHTLVFEDPGVPSAAGPEPLPRSLTLRVYPNPCRTQAVLLGAPSVLARVVSLRVFDVAGRLVREEVVGHDPSGPVLWRPTDIASGVYILRLVDLHRRAIASTRVTVIRAPGR